MEKKFIDISDYEYLLELSRNQMECDSYLNILTYLLKNNYNVDNKNYRYYESQYLNAYFKLFDSKNKFSNYLANILKTRDFEWDIDFINKKAIISFKKQCERGKSV